MSEQIKHAPECSAAGGYGGKCSCTDLVELLRAEDDCSSWTGKDGLFALSAAELTSLRARVAELEAALRPFAAEAVKIDGDPEWFGNGRYSDDKTCILSGLTMGQLRATRAALEEKDA